MLVSQISFVQIAFKGHRWRAGMLPIVTLAALPSTDLSGK
jgi:hypothetical protein